MLPQPSIGSVTVEGVTLLGDPRIPGGVSFGFTERGGGVSEAPFASLNLGLNVEDDPAAVAANRVRALEALGAPSDLGRLIAPVQVHGDTVVLLDKPGDEALQAARAEALAGADAVVCTVPGVSVLLCYADCCPVVLAATGGFAVIHSGWKGTYAGISAKALGVLCRSLGVAPDSVNCYLGPHIAGVDYEVSGDLLERFTQRFGNIVVAAPGHLSLAAAIEQSLVHAGAQPCRILDIGLSTPQHVDRFFSYRAEHGRTGRHGAIAHLIGS